MVLKAGDRVKFVNEKGEGRISRILTSSRVLVEIEDGFEIPYLLSDLIKIDENESDKANIYNTAKEIIKDSEKAESLLDESRYIGTEQVALKRSSLLEYEAKGVYLAFVPQNQRLPEAGDKEVFLINHSDARLLYSIYLKDNRGKYYAKSYGVADEESKLRIEIIDYNKLNSWSQGFIQLIYFNYLNNQIIAPVSEEFKIPIYRDKSFKAENYKSSVFFEEEKAVVIIVSSLKFQVPGSESDKEFEKDEDITTDKETLTESLKTKQDTIDNIREDFIQKYIKDEGFAEVDMHIWELADNYSRLSPNEIFNIQMNYFNKCLESAMVNRLRKVVFIHGVGNGTLKKEIRSKLATEYPEITVYDGEIAKYGVGATEIIIPQNLRI